MQAFDCILQQPIDPKIVEDGLRMLVTREVINAYKGK
jgi:hypothetical protein